MNDIMLNSVAEGLPLSPEQRWMLSGMEDRKAALLHIALEGELDERRLRDALDRVIARHHVLNHAFLAVPGYRGLRQQPLARACGVTWESRDLRGQKELDMQVQQDLSVARETRFDLAQGHVFHATLLRMADTRWQFMLAATSLVADRISLETLYTELVAAYQTDGGSPESDEVFQYSQFIEWRQELEAGEEAQQGREYWSAHLADRDAQQPLRLPYRIEAPAAGSLHNPVHRASVERVLDPQTAARALQVAHALGTTVELMMQAAWWALLARITGRYRFAAGWQHDCRRDYEALAGAVGVFEKILPLAVTLTPEDTFSAWVKQLAQTIEAHRGVQEYWPVDEPLDSSHLEVGFAFANVPSPCGEQLQWRVCELPGPSPVFELALQATVSPDGERTLVSIHYAPMHYSEASMLRLLDQYLVLLCGLVERPAARIHELSVVGSAERNALLAMNAAVLDCGTLALPARIAQWAERTPDAPALQDGERTLNYAELIQHANRLAHWLIAQGVGPERLVALNIERSIDLVVALLAVWRAGGAYLPLEPEWPQARRQRILADAKPVLVLSSSPFKGEVGWGMGLSAMHQTHPHPKDGTQACKPVPFRRRIACDPKPLLHPLEGEGIQGRGEIWVSHGADGDAWPCPQVKLDAIATEVAALPDAPPDVDVSLRNAAYVLYTSGSTGTPKGVVIEHAQLLNYTAAASQAMALDRCRRWALTTTVAADLGNTALFGALLNGACLVVANAEDMRDGESFARFMRCHAIEGLKIVPSHLEALLEAETPVLPQTLILGGEATPHAFVERIARLAPACRIFNHYGPTETTVGVMVHAVDPAVAPPGNVLPLTKVLPNCRVYVLDAAMNLAPTGALGEIYIGGAQVCRGYLNRTPDAVFVDDPFRPGERLYRSGDLGCHLPDGGIRLAGRADHQLKVRGFRIEPAEVEAALLRQPRVRQAVVTPWQPAQGGTELIAFLVADAGHDSVEGRRKLRTALTRDLPAAMLPSRFVFLAQVPRLANGKVDRRALADHALMPTAAATVAPRDDIEFVLVDCMARLLERECISVHDDFFELGGHSLLAIKLVARIRKLLKIEIPPATVFDHPSAAKLAAVLRACAQSPVQLEQLAHACRQPTSNHPQENEALNESAHALQDTSTSSPALTDFRGDAGNDEFLSGIEARCLNGRGTGVPLYCFPGIYVDAMDYAPIVDAVGTDRPVYGFVCHWLTEARWENRSVEELARGYAAFIRKTAVDGKCALLGWSFGGNLAFETARQLSGVVDVQFVGLVDVCQPRDLGTYEQFSSHALPQPHAGELVQAWLDGSTMKQRWHELFARMSDDEKTLADQYLLSMAESLPNDGPEAGSKEYDIWRAFSQYCVMNRYQFSRTDAPLYVWTAGETAKDETLILRDWLSIGDVRSTEMITSVSHRGITRHWMFLTDLKKRLKSLD